MKRKESLEKLIENFDYELDTNNENGHSDDWYNVHINMLYIELCDIRDTLFVFKEVEKEWEKRAEDKSISYSRIRTLIYEAMPYKVVMGLSKIFVGTQEASIEKAINVVSQRAFYQKKEVRLAIDNIREFLANSPMVKVVTTYRDSFFGHLDNYCAMSDIRIDVSLAMERISISEIDIGIELIERLYKECFGEELTKPHRDVTREDIINTFFWM